MFTQTAEQIIDRLEAESTAQRGEQLTTDFLDMINNFHSLKQPYDPELEAYIHKIGYEAILNPPSKGKKQRGVHYFHPSSASSCLRELYHMAKGDKRDDEPRYPHQERWKKLGSMFGDLIQHDLLSIHKHYQKMTGNEPAYKPTYTTMHTKSGEILKVPRWEAYAKTYGIYDGVPIGGQPDGLLQYKDGSTIGLEIKSKQTSAARTSQFTMRGADPDHIKQVIAYSILYGIDEFLILYGNLSKKNWELSDEDLSKYPDLRCFYYRVTDEDRQELLSRFKSVLEMVERGTPPKLDVAKWTFNNYKRVIADTLTRDEIRFLEHEYDMIKQATHSLKEKNRLALYESLFGVIAEVNS